MDHDSRIRATECQLLTTQECLKSSSRMVEAGQRAARQHRNTLCDTEDAVARSQERMAASDRLIFGWWYRV